MNINIKYIYFFFIGLALSGCKKSENVNNSADTLGHDRLLMPPLAGDYEPKGLRKLSIIEMKKIGESGGIPSDLVWKDQRGNIVSPDYYGNGPDARYVQFYANAAGKVEEAIVYEMTPEIKAMMMLMKVATMPVEY